MTFKLPLTSWNIEKGRRLGILITTHDDLYLDTAAPGETVTLLGGSYIDLPTHR